MTVRGPLQLTRFPILTGAIRRRARPSGTGRRRTSLDNPHIPCFPGDHFRHGLKARNPEMCCFMEPRMVSGMQSHTREERQVLSILLAVFVLALTTAVHLCHTCHLRSNRLCSGSAPHHYVRADVRPIPHIEQTEGPCLACMFLNGINATEITLFFCLPSFLVGLFHLLVPQTEAFVSNYLISFLQSRAPPQVFSER